MKIKKLFNIFFLFSFIFIIFSCDIKKPTSRLDSVGRGIASMKHEKFTKEKCSTCHEKNRPAAISGAIHGSGSDCKSCHSYKSINGLVSWQNVTGFNHKGTITNCKSCHSQKMPYSNPHKINQPGAIVDCSKCHSPGSWKPAHFNHQFYIGKCNLCHGVVGASPTLNDKPIPKDQHPSSFYKGIDCVHCHNKSPRKWINTSFNQITHLPNPSTCVTCHEKKRPTAATSISGLPHSPGDCVFCHTSKTDWASGIVAFDHELRAPNSCLSCHSNKKPLPPDQHPSLNTRYKKLDCILCHTYSKVTSPRNWSKITFNDSTHQPAPVSCVTCHKSIVNDSRPISGTHNQGSRASATCKSCHKFELNNPIASKNKSWKNFNSIQSIHVASATDQCKTCHNVSQNLLSKKSARHLNTTKDCNLCHRSTNPVSWLPVKMVHSPADTNCKSCHNGSTAKGKKTGHILTSSQCSICHTQSAWLPASGGQPAKHFKTTQTMTQKCTFCHKNPQVSMKIPNFFSNYVHSRGGRYPGNHRFGNTCNRCHYPNSDGVKWQNYNFIGSCAACHANDFDPGEGDHRPGGVAANKMCNDCHKHNLPNGSF